MGEDSLINLRWFLIGGFPNGVSGGLVVNIAIAAAAFAASFSLGHLLALGRLSRSRALRWTCTAYIELMRSVPLLIVLFWFHFSIPILLGSAPSPLVSALVALSAYGAAYQAEYIRAGIQSVDPGQREAAHSLGLSRTATLFRVVLAQAHRKMLPTYASYFTSMFKDTSALYMLGLVELMQAGLIVAERAPAQILPVYLTVGSLFFIVCFTASRAAQFLERRLTPGRSPNSLPAQPRSSSALSRNPLKEKHHAHA